MTRSSHCVTQCDYFNVITRPAMLSIVARIILCYFLNYLVSYSYSYSYSYSRYRPASSLESRLSGCHRVLSVSISESSKKEV